ncbi:MAG: NAD-dependent epimerase/dehydratase family protein [Acidaminococcaceae bacterium]
MEVVAITGLTGKSGGWMLQRMLREQELLNDYYFKVAVQETSNTKCFSNVQFNYEFVVGNLKDEDYLKKLCFGIDTLFHIAGIDKSLLLVQAAVKAGVKRIVLVHTTGIYSKYKEAGELYRHIENTIAAMIEGKDISITILRPTMIYGNLKDGNISVFIRMVDKLRVFPVVDHANYALQPVWAKDLGEAYYQVLINPTLTKNKDYILSGGAEILLIDIFRTIGNYLCKKNKFISIPYHIAYVGAWCLYCFTFGQRDFREKVQRLVEQRVFSHQAATKDFGYNPATFEVGVKAEIEEYIKMTRTSN